MFDEFVASPPTIAVIGGGTGSFTLLNSLKHFTPRLTALVNMIDDGGSTGELRDELGVLPPGDVRQCLVALSHSEQLRDIFNYRFPKGSKFQGHTIGNLFISGIENMTKNFADAVSIASDVLHITGQVVPITLDNRRLVVKTVDGKIFKGEHVLDTENVPNIKGATVTFDKATATNPAAEHIIRTADMIVIAPGDLYTSITPALAIKGVGEALLRTKAKCVYVCNLVNKERHTVGFAVEDYIEELERVIGGPALDYVLYNTQAPSKEQFALYAQDNEFPVTLAGRLPEQAHCKIIGGDFLSKSSKLKRSADDLITDRSLIRHDGQAIARALMRIYFE